MPSDVPAVEGPNLHVSGTGIVATGGSCQLQTSGIESPRWPRMERAPSTNNVVVGLCHKSILGNSTLPFLPNAVVIKVSSGGPRHMDSAAGSVVPGAGTWAVGFCAQSQGGSTLHDNGNVNGWAMVTNGLPGMTGSGERPPSRAPLGLEESAGLGRSPSVLVNRRARREASPPWCRSGQSR